MKKIVYVVVILIVLIGVFFFFSRNKTMAPTISYSNNPTPSESQSPVPSLSPTPSTSIQATKTPQTTPQTFIMTYSNGKINPQNLTIRKGDTVKFVNNDSARHWPASDPHPSHTICPGFDSLKALETGDSYSHAFDVVKTCPFHDHFNASNSGLRGQIVVTQ